MVSPVQTLWRYCSLAQNHRCYLHNRNSDPGKMRISNLNGTLEYYMERKVVTWWRHQMETFSALLAICAGNSPVPGEFPTQTPVTRSFDVYFDLRPNKRLSKQLLGWWFETLSPPLWRHRNEHIITSINVTLLMVWPSYHKLLSH